MTSRRTFVKKSSMAGLATVITPALIQSEPLAVKKIGMIGLDTSHSPAFTKLINSDQPAFKGYQVTHAYPQGSKKIESSYSRIPRYIEEVKGFGVEIVESIDDLLQKVDYVLLETNDGTIHLEQARPVLKAGKPVFIDKPVAAGFDDVVQIYQMAEDLKVPIFSSSSLRYMSSFDQLNEKVGKVVGCDAFSPASLQEDHTDLYWYGIHGVEILFTTMGKGCRKVSRTFTDDTDFVVGTWEDGRIGTFRGKRSGKHDYGGIAHGTEGTMNLGPYDGYGNLVEKIIKFFETGKPPVDPEETIEIYAFMSAADESKAKGGAEISLEPYLNKFQS